MKIRRIVWIFRRVALAFFDVLNPPVPNRVARWMPGFLKATPREVAQYERWRAKLRGPR